MGDTGFKILAVALYASVLLLIGFLASRRMNNIRDYFASGKRLAFSTSLSRRAQRARAPGYFLG